MPISEPTDNRIREEGSGTMSPEIVNGVACKLGIVPADVEGAEGRPIIAFEAFT
jgi:hypothetical protein